MRPPIIDLVAALVVGADHPSTSRDAAVQAQRFALGRLGGIVALLIDNPAGLADFEGSELMGLPPDTYRPLRGKLVKLGAVVNTGKRRATPSGCEAIVWALASLQQEVQR